MSKYQVSNSSSFNFADYVEKMLMQYGVDVADAVDTSCREVAKEAVQKLKTNSPKGKRGKYAKGWAAQFEKGRLQTSATVYGKSGTYQLAHLLEHGHARRGGGRNVDAIVHISPVEQWAIDKVQDRVVEKIGG